MKTVTKKIYKQWFDRIASGEKKYELRLADFDLEKGDILRLEEWEGEEWKKEDRKPTGRFLEKKITYLRKVDLQKWIENQPELVEKGFYVIQFE
jgi:hypothetical protein